MTASTTRTRLHSKPIYSFLVASFPQFRCGKHERLDVEAFAEALKMSKEGVYKWLRGNKISVEGAAKLRELNPDIDKKALLPFLELSEDLRALVNL